MRLFVRIAETGSLSKVAQALGTTQPVISRRIAAVEQAWGGRLLHRTGRGVTLTELGEQTLPKVRELLSQADMLAEDISCTRPSPSGTVRIATLPSVALLVVPALLRHIAVNRLNIKIEIVEGSSGQVEGWHANDQSDLSFLYRHSRLRSHETALAVVESCLIGRPDDNLLSASQLSFADLSGLPLALPPRPDNSRLALERLFRQQGLSLNVAIDVASLPLLTLVAQQPGHYTILPSFTVADAIGLGRVNAVPLVDPAFYSTIAAGRPLHRPLSTAAAVIMDLVRRVITEQVLQVTAGHFRAD